jgi:hypothetical protein
MGTNVETYGDQRVALDAMPAPKQNPGVASADTQIADAVGRNALLIQGVRERAKAEADQTAVLDKVNAHTAAMNDVLWHPDSGAMYQKGESSFGQPERVAKEFDKLTNDLQDELTDPQQKEKFRQIMARQSVETHATVLRHVGQQTEVYKQQTYDDTVANLHTSALNNVGQPDEQEKIAQALALSAHTRVLQMPGASKETIDRVNAADTSNLHADVTSNLLTAGDYMRAKSYFEANKADIAPVPRAKLEAAVGDGTVRALGQAEATRIFDPSKSLEVMHGEADQIKDQRIQAEAKQRIDQFYTTHRASVEQRSTDLYKEMLGTLAKDPNGISAIPKLKLDELEALDGQKYAAILATGVRAAKNEDVTTAEGAEKFNSFLASLSGAMGDTEKNKALAQGYEIYTPVMSRADLRIAAAAWTKAKNGGDMTSEAEIERIASVTLGLSQFPPHMLNANGTVNIEAVAFRTAFRKRIEISRAAGKNLTPEEMQGEANRLMIPVETSKGYFGGSNTVPAFMLGVDKKNPLSAVGGGVSAGAYALTLPAFSDTQVADAKAMLKKRGAPTDDDAVLQYLQSLAGDGLRPGNTKPHGADAKTPSWHDVIGY